MSDIPLPQTVASPPEASRAATVAIWLFLASATLCVLGYLALAVPGPWFSSVQTLQWTARDVSVTRGNAQVKDDTVTVHAPDASGMALLAINTSFRSADYRAIAWDAANVPKGVSAALLWRNEYQPERVFSRQLTVEGGRIAPTLVANDPNWIGKINGLALALRGEFSEPLRVKGVAAKPMTAAQVLNERFAEWFAFEPWHTASINARTGGAEEQELPLPILIAVVVALAGLVYAALARWRSNWVGAFRPSVVGGLFLAAWLILDIPWQWNLMRQLHVTFDQYAGKSWRERHLAAEDGALFSFVEKVDAKLPPPPARVIVAADSHYLRDRTAYFLYPHNVYFDPWQNTMPTPAVMRPGDYLVVYHRKDVQFDASQQRLRWDGGSPVSAEPLLIDAGAALFRIR